jgi:hypothetical protein
MSGRRMRLLFDNCVAVVATGMLPALKDAVFTALQWSIPHRAHGDVTGVVVARAHAAAVAVLARPEDDISRRLLLVRDPVERVEIALQTDDVDLTAAVILDARAQLGAVAGVGLSVRLFAPLVANHSDLPAVLFEALAEDLSAFEALGEHTETVHTRSKRYHLANAVARATSGLAEDEAWIESVLWVGFRSKKTFDPDDVVRVCRRVSQIPILGGVA